MAKPKTDLTPPRPQDIAAKAQPFIERIEFVDDEKAEKNAEYAEAKKIIVEEAERAGIEPKALKAILRRRKFERKEREAREKLDIDERAQLEALAAAFGDDTPFGAFARSIANGEVSLSVADDIDHLAR